MFMFFILMNTFKSWTNYWSQLNQVKGLSNFECHYWKLLCPELKEMSKNLEEILYKGKRM